MKTLLGTRNLEEGEPVIVADRFRLVRPIGKGGAGEVFEAVQLSVDRVVALKVLHASNNASADYRERFSREAKAVARLNHPNCLTLHDFGYSEELDCLYMVTEFVQGRELFDLLVGGEPIPLRTSLRFAVQITEAIAHAHESGILHRDLKAENVLISEAGQVKVLDFGLAKILDEIGAEGGRRLTAQGAIYGTPQYMSPEQCHGDLTLDARADIYSLGVLLYEMFSGKPPFDTTDVMKLLMQHIREPAPPLPVELPAELCDLVMSCLRKDREERPSSAAELAETLQTMLVTHAMDSGEIPADISQELSRRLIRQNFPDDTPDPMRVSDHLSTLPPEDLVPAPTRPEPGSPGYEISPGAEIEEDLTFVRRVNPIWIVIGALAFVGVGVALVWNVSSPEPTHRVSVPSDEDAVSESPPPPVEEPREPQNLPSTSPPGETADPAEGEPPVPRADVGLAAKTPTPGTKPTKPTKPTRRAAVPKARPKPASVDSSERPKSAEKPAEKPTEKLPTLEFDY